MSAEGGNRACTAKCNRIVATLHQEIWVGMRALACVCVCVGAFSEIRVMSLLSFTSDHGGECVLRTVWGCSITTFVMTTIWTLVKEVTW